MNLVIEVPEYVSKFLMRKSLLICILSASTSFIFFFINKFLITLDRYSEVRLSVTFYSNLHIIMLLSIDLN